MKPKAAVAIAMSFMGIADWTAGRASIGEGCGRVAASRVGKQSMGGGEMSEGRSEFTVTIKKNREVGRQDIPIRGGWNKHPIPSADTRMMNSWLTWLVLSSSYPTHNLSTQSLQH